jgi:hypothetical protein
MHNEGMKSLKIEVADITNETLSYECTCDKIKQIRVVFDGGFENKQIVKYCENCYDQEDKEFMLSMERLSL